MMGGCYGISPIRRVAHIASAALVLSALGCASSKSSESQFSGSSEAVFSGTVTEKLEEGPVKITETAERTDKAGRIVRHTKVTERAPSSKTTETKSEAHQEGSLKAESAAQSASKPSLGFLVWPWILGAAGAALAAFLAWRLKPAWLKAVLGLLGR